MKLFLLFSILLLSAFAEAQNHRVIKIRRINPTTMDTTPVFIEFYFNILESPSLRIHPKYDNTLWFIPPDSIREDKILLQSESLIIGRKKQFYYQFARSKPGQIMPFQHFPTSYQGREYAFLECYYQPDCRKGEKAFKGYPPMNLMLRQEHLLESQTDSAAAEIHIHHLREKDTVYMGTFFLPLQRVCMPSLKMRVWDSVQPIETIRSMRDLELEPFNFDHKKACQDARIKHYRLSIYRKKRKKPYFQVEGRSERMKYKALSIFNTKLRSDDQIIFDEIYSNLGTYPPLKFTVK